MGNEIKRLYRSRKDRMLSGVCAGLAEYFEIDPTVVRLAFTAAFFLGMGSILVVYFIMLLVVPEAPLNEITTN
jgi:phage shock protein C